MTDKKTNLEKQEDMPKEVAFYQTFLSAWVENRMEMDKQLLILSSLAIGLLMIFYNNLNNLLELALWLLAGGLFISTIIVILCVFRNNSKYIEYMLSEKNTYEKNTVEKKLQKQTTAAFGMFIIAIITTFTLAIVKSGFIITKIQGI